MASFDHLKERSLLTCDPGSRSVVHKLGLQTVYDCTGSLDPKTSVDIVAVHGIGAESDKTWITNNVNWLCDAQMLPKAVPNTRILQFGYESQWLGKVAIQQRLPLVADQLLQSLVNIRTACVYRPIIFIGHCFGGLVIEKALISAKLHIEDFPGIVQSTAGIVFLGTPHRGSHSQSKASIIASVASAFGYGEDTSLLRTVERDSEMLNDLIYDFTRTVNTSSIPLFCFFEQHKSDISKIVKRKGSLLPAYREMIVDETSGCIDGFPKLGLACDHFQINRFSHPKDTNFRFVREEIVRLVTKAPGRVQSRLQPLSIIQNSSLIHDDRDLECMQALFITDPFDDMERIQNKQDKLLEETGAWILSDTTFTKWLNEEFSRLLWLHGDPGKGKTMLAISLVRELSSRISLEGSASTTTALVYFFCDNKDSRKTLSAFILRGLIYQLLCQRPDLCFYLRDQYEKQKEQLFSSPNAVQSLWRIFQNITGHPSLQRVYVIVDALDECEAESVESLLTLLDPEFDLELHEKDSQTESNHKIKWLLTSRNESAIRQCLIGSLEISLETNHVHVEEAVRKFIDVKTKQLQRRKGYDDQLKQFVNQYLRQNAEGTFLWVALACRELSKPTVLSMNTKAVLLKLPSGIAPLYGRILDQVLNSDDEELAQCAKSILRCMVVALRPLTLSELAIAANLPYEHRHNLPVLGEYVTQCGSLVTIRHNIVYFVHLSAKAYIVSMSTGSILSEHLRAEHEFVALNCFDYICTRLARERLKTPYSKNSETSETEPEYPVLFWTDHTRYSPMEIADHFDLGAEFFHPRSAQRQAWFDTYWEKMHAKWETQPSNFTALHFAAYTGLSCILSKLLVTNHQVDLVVLDSLGNTPLLWAAKYGYELCIRLLLKVGADTAIKNYEGMTALQWAAGNGHTTIVQLLFDNNASVETQDKNGWTPLHRAAYNGHTNVVKLLLHLGANIEAVDGSTWTALHRAASSGQFEVVRLLIESGASIHALDRESMTPMLHAAWAGHVDVVKLHLEQQADIETKDLSGWTSLHNAAWNGHEIAVQFLLKQKANVHAKNGDGTTPLHHATWSGHSSVVKLLVGAGADVNAQDDEGETPLQQAAWRGHVSCTKLLLTANVAVDMTNNVGHTALHQAASSGQEEIVQILLEVGADPTIVDKHGQSARALAEANDHEVTANLLKEKEEELAKFSEGTTTPVDKPLLDPAVAEALSIDYTISTTEPHQAAGFFVPEKITTLIDGKRKYFYMKSGWNKEMFESEYISLSKLHEAVPTLGPRPLAWGKFSLSDNYYLVTEWIDVEARDGGSGPGTGLTLAQKVAKLHNIPAPIPNGYTTPVFGFPITTYCGSTPQNNTYCSSWAKFFAEFRLRSICKIIEENHGTDNDLTTWLDRLIDEVVPRLLGNGRLGGKKGITPVLIHGDLWEGNKAKGKFDDRDGIEPVTFDPSCCYAHSEFELGIMRMFGGFSAGFFNEYHHLVPKTEPKSEYSDRMELYELYHYLNHYAIYSGGYREDVMDSMKKLCAKYSKQSSD